MITSIKLFKESKINENIDGLTLDQKFTVSEPFAYTVNEIIEIMIDTAEEFDENITKEDIFNRLTPELCQEFVNLEHDSIMSAGTDTENYFESNENLIYLMLNKTGFVLDEDVQDEFESKKTNESKKTRKKIKK